jgi:hypothetical protein
VDAAAVAWDGAEYIVVWEDVRTTTVTGGAEIRGTYLSTAALELTKGGFDISRDTAGQYEPAVAAMTMSGQALVAYGGQVQNEIEARTLRPTFGPGDAGTADGGAPDLGAPDAGAPDLGAQDAGAPDLGAPDLGAPDLGAPDLGLADTSGTDAGGSGSEASGCHCETTGRSTVSPEAALLLLALLRRRRRKIGGPEVC